MRFTTILLPLVGLIGCGSESQPVKPPGNDSEAPAQAAAQSEPEEPEASSPAPVRDDAVAPISNEPADPIEKWADAQRAAMVDEQLRARDITDGRVLNTMRQVKRHLFVRQQDRELAYADRPLPIGHRQTISQPYMVALMTQLVRPQKDEIALDVGAGSGYQAAVLAKLVKQVYSIEIICPLADQARERLKSLGYDNVAVRCGDGYRGCPEHAPFDVIVVAAAPDHIPQPLIDQLAVGGRLVIPVGTYFQKLLLVEKGSDGSLTKRSVALVAFVPLTRNPNGKQAVPKEAEDGR